MFERQNASLRSLLVFFYTCLPVLNSDSKHFVAFQVQELSELETTFM